MNWVAALLHRAIGPAAGGALRTALCVSSALTATPCFTCWWRERGHTARHIDSGGQDMRLQSLVLRQSVRMYALVLIRVTVRSFSREGRGGDRHWSGRPKDPSHARSWVR